MVLFLFLFILSEISSLLGLHFLKETRGIYYQPVNIISDEHRKIIETIIKQDTKYFAHSPELSWTIKKNGEAWGYKANSQGIRSDYEYAFTPPTHILRIASFGDSFTHCSDVRNGETWQDFMVEINPNIEVLNFGVDAFGLDQAFLRYLNDGIKFNPNIVLIGFMSENIYRSVNVFRPFYYPNTGAPETKPRFVVRNNDLVLLENPIPRPEQYNKILESPSTELPKLGKNDYFYHLRYQASFMDFLASVRLFKVAKNKIREKYFDDDKIVLKEYYNPKSEAFQVTTGIFKKFYEITQTNNSLPTIVMFPQKSDLKRYLRKGTKQYSPLLEWFDERGYIYIDLMNAFDSAGKNYSIDELFTGVSLHYSPLANRLVAKHILDFLRDKDLLRLKKEIKK